MAEKKLKTLQFEGLNTTYVLPEVDPTSSISGDAADAKIVGDHLTDVNNPHGVTLEQLGASKTIVTDENEDGHIILKSYLSDNGSGNISTHISDRSNPHKVTAAQVGADVSGAAKQALEDAKGYTDEVITNLIGGAPDTLNTLQELAEAMEANVEVVDVLEKAITGKADNSTLTAHIDNKNNPHNVTIEQIGAAPAGYGLGLKGGELPVLDDCHNAMSTGWYHVKEGQTANLPSSAVSGVLRADIYGWVYGVLTLYTPSYGGMTILQKKRTGDGWEDWEFVNPPMQLGVEYRTTERWNGKPVYTQLFNAGLMADGKQVDIPNLTASYMIIRRSETFNNGLPLPWFYSYENKNIKVEYNKSSSANKYYAIFDSHSDIGANYTVYIQLWYTKD